jgi:YidC/Oxa1 family membrane protein insertase
MPMKTTDPAGRKAPAFNIRRFIATLAVFAVAGGIVAVIVSGNGGAPAPAEPSATAAAAPATTPGTPAATTAPATPAAPAPAAAQPASKPAPMDRWSARAPGSPVTEPTSLGSLDPATHRFRVDFDARGAGIAAIRFSDQWVTEVDARSAARARAAGAAPDSLGGRYEFTTPGTLQGFRVSMLAARAVDVDGQEISLAGAVWAEAAPGTFVSELVDQVGALQMRVTRAWRVEPGSYDIRCEQRVENLSASPRTVRWVQFGPAALPREVGIAGSGSASQGGGGDLVDARRFHAGYLMSKERDPGQATVIVHGATLDHSAVIGQVDAGDFRLWPNRRQQEERYGLSWFGSTNRYFALAVHAPYAPPGSPSRAVAPSIGVIQAQAGEGTYRGAPDRVAFTDMTSDAVTAAPGAAASFDVGVFAGPLERSLLGGTEPYAALNMQGLILYLMSGCCTWCTFSWLADLLVWFLSFLHDHVVFDWGLAIIVLVVVVRGLLHPLTRRSQISMMRVTKQMASVKPELEAIQKRHKDDPKRVQEETIRLYREKGINPLGCAGGMVPTFLQMPIWIALYAVLYYAFELRQQPAFFGVFQKLGDWPFLADLSAQDRFIPLPFSVNLYVFELSSVNLIPLLMGLVFWIQQKYMAPPPSPNMTPEQEQQQKMMKWMMVILFPLMLYAAPSGLTLYIATSTLVGIYESKRVRAEVEKMDFSRPQPGKGGWLQGAYDKAMRRMQETQRAAEARRGAPKRPYRDR